jgi:hypothetical protein
VPGAGVPDPAVTGAAAYRGTIPRLLAGAADRDSDGVWLRSDSGSLTSIRP